MGVGEDIGYLEIAKKFKDDKIKKLCIKMEKLCFGKEEISEKEVDKAFGLLEKIIKEKEG
jgi:hypothetical protein